MDVWLSSAAQQSYSQDLKGLKKRKEKPWRMSCWSDRSENFRCVCLDQSANTERFPRASRHNSNYAKSFGVPSAAFRLQAHVFARFCLFVFLFTSIHFWQMFLLQAHIFFCKCVFYKRIFLAKLSFTGVHFRQICLFSTVLYFWRTCLLQAHIFGESVIYNRTFLANVSFIIAHFVEWLLQSHIFRECLLVSHFSQMSFAIAHFWRICYLYSHILANVSLIPHIFCECVFHNRIFCCCEYVFYKLRRDRVNCFSYSFCFEESDGKRKCHQRGAGVWRLTFLTVCFFSTEQSVRCRDLTSLCQVSVSHPLTAEAVGCVI